VLDDEQVAAAASFLQPKSFAGGSKIIAKGDLADTLYLLKRGAVDVIRQGKTVVHYTAGSYFGDNALSRTMGTRNADCVARGPVECLVLSRENFVAVRNGPTVTPRGQPPLKSTPALYV
jgi:CRP-like cAMP-binding protein